MTVTKSTVQISILLLSSVIVAGLWVANSQDDVTVSAAPSQRQAAPITPTVTAIKKAPPTRVMPSPNLDANALTRIERAEQLSLAQFDAKIAEAKARVRKANQQEREFGQSNIVPSVSVLGHSPRVSQGSSKPLPMIERFTLGGLVVKEGAAYAYLSVDGQTPIRAVQGQRIKGVLVSHISREGVQLKNKGTTRTLEGGL
ncbi:hypothetical protein AB4562_03810 [Vibrio sp. 10N.222.54.A1]|uniref:hypothetical protein n=2 Tax=Vibrio TaxID=662 RepID=UPI0010BD4C7F|nr:hypothetical protein [Vibrio sp. F13]TKF95578.1 hypothetical protein FCV67_24390 [Vibrio sp. F13]